jgi:hypothetical protein
MFLLIVADNKGKDHDHPESLTITPYANAQELEVRLDLEFSDSDYIARIISWGQQSSVGGVLQISDRLLLIRTSYRGAALSAKMAYMITPLSAGDQRPPADTKYKSAWLVKYPNKPDSKCPARYLFGHGNMCTMCHDARLFWSEQEAMLFAKKYRISGEDGHEPAVVIKASRSDIEYNLKCQAFCSES